MNKTLWKLDRMGERLWAMAALAASQAVAMGYEGRGIAIVAEETRTLGNQINDAVEKVMVAGEELNSLAIKGLAFQIHLLALNCAIESSRITGYMGKQAALFAGEIRDLAFEIICMYDDEPTTRKIELINPYPANPSTVALNGEFLLLTVGDLVIVESLANIREIIVLSDWVERKENLITVRSMDLPLVDVYKKLDKKTESQTMAIIWTPWAKQNKTYAVTANILGIINCPIGTPTDPPADMPLSKYVRECWENEHGQPFYFMDWAKMVL